MVVDDPVDFDEEGELVAEVVGAYGALKLVGDLA